MSNILMPAIAVISGAVGSLCMFAFIGVKLLSGKLLITKGIPTLAGIYSAQCTTPSKHSRFINILIPLTMIMLFNIHHIGQAAWAYSLFWLIPICCEILRYFGINSIFSRLLAATFVTHAIGSVMWLYCMPTTPATWLGLLTIVPAERLVFASGGTIAAVLLTKAAHFLHKTARTKASTSLGKKDLLSQSPSEANQS